MNLVTHGTVPWYAWRLGHHSLSSVHSTCLSIHSPRGGRGGLRPTIFPTEEPLRARAVTGRMETGSSEIRRWLYLASPQFVVIDFFLHFFCLWCWSINSKWCLPDKKRKKKKSMTVMATSKRNTDYHLSNHLSNNSPPHKRRASWCSEIEDKMILETLRRIGTILIWFAFQLHRHQTLGEQKHCFWWPCSTMVAARSHWHQDSGNPILPPQAVNICSVLTATRPMTKNENIWTKLTFSISCLLIWWTVCILTKSLWTKALK